MKPYPLIFQPILKDKVWGGRSLTDLGKNLGDDPQRLVGESWELVDLDHTSADGGGGGAEQSRILNGEMRGLTIRDAMRAMGSNLMGTVRSTEGGFPLLVKFLDAAQNLSVQVHPSPQYAQAHPDAHLKTESWYIVSAKPGSKIYKGVKPGVTAQEFTNAIKTGDVENRMIVIDAVPGEFHHLPSGTCHALGAGIVIAEIQMPSDTTFRVYDWGRTGRTLHIDEAVRCIDFGPCAGDESRPMTEAGSRTLTGNPHYRIDEHRLNGASTLNLHSDGKHPRALVITAGGVELFSDAQAFASLLLPAGSTVLLPAALTETSVRSRTDAVLLEVEVRGG
ncbi:MAG: type I phosphomannose isomerase catalytic subunit [Phycisphaerales bacterium]